MGHRTSRILAVEPFVNNKLITIPMQPDTTLIGLKFRIYGSVQTTYTGTPLGRPEGPFDSLIPRIDVITNGQDTHKSIRPFFLAMQQFIASGVENERFASAGASALANAHPTTPQAFVYGTSGQVTTIREGIYMPFEHVYCEPGYGREMTWLNLKNYNTAEIKIQCGNIANLLQEGNAATVTYANIDLKIEVSTIEDQSVPQGVMFDIWKQTMLNRTFKGSARDVAVEMPKSDSLSGMMFYTTNGDTNKLPTNDLVESLGVRRSGTNTFQKYFWKSLQSTNRDEFGAVAPFSGGSSRLDGVAVMNFLNEKKINNALPSSREKGVTSLDLMLDISTLGTYTPNEAQVAMMFDELLFVPRPQK